MLKKEAIIEELDGIVVSDPWYGKDVWCRYESDIQASNWKLEFECEIEHDNEYNFDTVVFNVKLGKPEIISKIKMNDNGFSYPSTLDIKEYTIGMDTACFCIGSKKNYEKYGNGMAINTCTDGILGDVYEMKLKMLNSKQPDAILFMGAIDADFINQEELFKAICRGFDGKELYIDKPLEDKLKHIQGHIKERNDSGIKELVNIGFGNKSDFRPTIWNYANKLMEVLAEERLVEEHNFGRGKGKWKFVDDKMSIDVVIEKAKELKNPKIKEITKKYANYLTKLRSQKER